METVNENAELENVQTIETTETVENTQEVVENNDIIRPILEEVGLLADFPDIFEFDDTIDLDSNEGIKEVISKTIKAGYSLFLDELQENPELYSIYLHYQSGGNIDSFKNDVIKVLPNESLNNNVSLQQQVYEDSLRKKGLSDDIVSIIVAKAIENENLLELSLEVNDNNRKQQEDLIKQQESERLSIIKQNNETGQVLTQIVQNSIRSNDFSTLKVGQEVKQELYNSLSENIEIIRGVGYYKVPISNDNVKSLIENHLLLIKPEYKTKLVNINNSANKIASLKDKRSNVKTGASASPTDVNNDGLEEIRRNLM